MLRRPFLYVGRISGRIRSGDDGIFSGDDGLFGLLHEAGCEAVNAEGVFLTAVVVESGFAFGFGPAVELVSLADVVEEGNVHAAGGLDEVDVEEDKLTSAGWLGVVEV